ncbi:PREDICTED: uncharacterized protein LOC109153822 [Ipomoea nil]|uniref:uncharacterized protein LOC109153822 n=1 Tax=Ipomoea nil TaxID=35883 RepID=UPI0009008A71|nr:PREDICTED: uncharacterized protein LOC109153822 [Ipomoea nil]
MAKQQSQALVSPGGSNSSTLPATSTRIPEEPPTLIAHTQLADTVQSSLDQMHRSIATQQESIASLQKILLHYRSEIAPGLRSWQTVPIMSLTQMLLRLILLKLLKILILMKIPLRLMMQPAPLALRQPTDVQHCQFFGKKGRIN